ncbi:hypothetical protein ACR9HT_17735 [Enterobacter wuhouensis]
MITFTKEQLIASAHARIEFAEMMLAGELEPLKESTWSIELELARIALASLEAEELILYRERNPYNGLTTGWQELTDDEYEFIKDNAGENAEFRTVYTAPPAPVAVPDEVLARLEHEANHLTAWHHIDEHSCKVYRRDLLTLVNACRAAMLQGGK